MYRFAMIVALTFADPPAVLTSQTQPVSSTAEPPFHADKFLMKGRLLSVYARPMVEPHRNVVAMQIVIDEPYAVIKWGQAPGSHIENIVTDWPWDELTTLNRQNYLQSIESMLPKGVVLGESYLIVATRKSFVGLELKSIEPATPDSEQKFIADNKAYLLGFREYMHKTAMLAAKQFLEMQRNNVIKLIGDGGHLSGKSAEVHARFVNEQIDEFRKKKLESLASMKNVLDSLGREIESTKDHDTRLLLESMAASAKSTLQVLELVEPPVFP
jgi:hypothetical protein